MLPAVIPSFCGLPWNGEPAGRDREIYRRGLTDVNKLKT